MDEVKHQTEVIQQQSALVKHLHTLLLSMCTLLMTITVGFLWTLRADFAVSQERTTQHAIKLEILSVDVKALSQQVTTQGATFDKRISVLENGATRN